MSSRQPVQPVSPVPPGPDPLPPAKRSQLQRCYQRAHEQSHKDKPDHDYAHTMYTECVVNDPANLVYTEAMLDNLQRKYKNNKKGSKLISFGGGLAKGIKKSLTSQDWESVFRQGLEMLQSNPWDVAALRAMAQACEANHYNEVELRYLKNALDANPKDVEVNKHCARSLTRMGQFDQAIACWHRVEELQKADEEAPRMISILTVARQKLAAGQDILDDLLEMLRGSGPGSGQGRRPPSRPSTTADDASNPATSPSAQPTDTSPSLAPQQAAHPDASGVERTVRQQLQLAIQQDPTDLTNYQKLAELWIEENRFADAEKVLSRGLDASGGDLKIREALEDLRIRRVQANLAIADGRAESGDDAARDLAKRLRAELNRLEMEIYRTRVDRYPHRPELKFELAMRLKRAAKFEEAVPFFQEGRSSPPHQAAATLELGECLQQLKQYAKALKCYRVAAQEDHQDLPVQKLALYRLGVLAAALKEPQVACQAFTRLVGLQPDYKDAQARLDKLAEIHDKE